MLWVLPETCIYFLHCSEEITAGTKGPLGLHQGPSVWTVMPRTVPVWWQRGHGLCSSPDGCAQTVAVPSLGSESGVLSSVRTEGPCHRDFLHGVHPGADTFLAGPALNDPSRKGL